MAEGQKTAHKDIKKEVETRGYTLLSEYKNAKTRLEIECPKHNGKVIKLRINDFRASTNVCRECYLDSRRTPFKKVKELFNEKGYELISEEYFNQTTPLWYICPNHPDKPRKTTYNSLRDGHGCYECGIESISGDKSVHYNHDLTDEERKHNRTLDPEERKWKISVFRRDNYTCWYCGKYDRNDLNAHHKDGHHWCVERRYDVSNGATLCIDCHKSFHLQYGYKNNTEEQFDEWITKRGRR